GPLYARDPKTVDPECEWKPGESLPPQTDLQGKPPRRLDSDWPSHGSGFNRSRGSRGAPGRSPPVPPRRRRSQEKHTRGNGEVRRWRFAPPDPLPNHPGRRGRLAFMVIVATPFRGDAPTTVDPVLSWLGTGASLPACGCHCHNRSRVAGDQPTRTPPRRRRSQEKHTRGAARVKGRPVLGRAHPRPDLLLRLQTHLVDLQLERPGDRL